MDLSHDFLQSIAYFFAGASVTLAACKISTAAGVVGMLAPSDMPGSRSLLAALRLFHWLRFEWRREMPSRTALGSIY
ncbi:MAG: hypothetical protein ACI9UU_001675 [Candidatus Azotimanducaceae bacterium]